MGTPKKPFFATTAFKLELKLYEAVKPFLIICQLFCAAPASVHRVEPLQDHSSYYLINFLHITWCVLVSACLSSSIYTEYTTSNISLPTIQKPLYISEYIVYLFHVLFVMTTCYCNRASFAKNMRTIVTIDCKFMTLGISPCYEAIKRFFIMHLWLLVIYSVATASVNYFYSAEHIVTFLRTVMVYAVPNLIISVSITQYYGLLYANYLRYKSLIGALHTFQQNYKKDMITLKEPQQDVNRLRGIVSNLELFTKDVNSQFALSILTVYFGSFINISINIFLIYKYVDQLAEVNFASLMYSVIWIAMHIGKMFVILYYNHLIGVERENITLVLNIIEPRSEAMEITIRRFLLQMMMDTRAHFICGFLQLNMSFLKSLLENISVLVIFLIQYDVTFEALNNIHSTALTTSN